MLIMLPIVLPVTAALGSDPVWFGIANVIAIEIRLLRACPKDSCG